LIQYLTHQQWWVDSYLRNEDWQIKIDIPGRTRLNKIKIKHEHLRE
jgi:hypothetical protein